MQTPHTHNPALSQNRRPEPKHSWMGYLVIGLLCAAGVGGVVFGLRTPSLPTETTEQTTVVLPNPQPTDTVKTAKTEQPALPGAAGDRDAALIIRDVVVGNGSVASAGDVVKVHYVGTLPNGKEFDASRKHGNEPFKFDLGKGRVIKGWEQGVAGMKVGGKRKLIIPPHLGYGARGAGEIIPANATLLFDVELIAVEPNPTANPNPPKASDPYGGSFSISDATQDLPGDGRLVAEIDTSQGRMTCQLLSDKAPDTVANFIGLATGKRAWKDPNTQEWTNRPAYDGTTFHRVIKGFMIQGGDPKGNGSGEPGYTVKDEIWSGAKHDRAGLLCMANRGPNTNGAQFFITDAAAAHLDNSYTIFGECSPVSVVHDIAAVNVAGEKPVSPVAIKSVSIARMRQPLQQ